MDYKKDELPIKKVKEETEEELKARDEAVHQYDCGKSCRICPYPGTKCCQHLENMKNII